MNEVTKDRAISLSMMPPPLSQADTPHSELPSWPACLSLDLTGLQVLQQILYFLRVGLKLFCFYGFTNKLFIQLSYKLNILMSIWRRQNIFTTYKLLPSFHGTTGLKLICQILDRVLNGNSLHPNNCDNAVFEVKWIMLGKFFPFAFYGLICTSPDFQPSNHSLGLRGIHTDTDWFLCLFHALPLMRGIFRKKPAS